MEKTGESEIDPIGKGMPDDSDNDYEFKKVLFKPAVSRRQFHRRFYRCYKGGKEHSHFFRPCPKTCSNIKDALLRIPKRKKRVAEKVEEEKENVFWGLQAIEGVSLVRICLYHALFVAGPFVFWGLWLTVMGHLGDLQNASIPFLTALGLLSIFWFLLGHR
jgi:hypothetical protein